MYTLVTLLLLVTSSSQEEWVKKQAPSFLEDPTLHISEYFQEQKDKVSDLFTTSYEGAIRMTDSVNQYVEDTQKSIAEEMSRYVNKIEQTGRKMVDSLSFVPDQNEVDDEERLENPDVMLTVPSIIIKNGYDCETHTVQSKGYFLNIHRIPRSKYRSTTPSKTVILHHGLFASSADWILNGPGKALAYVLADAGYDVWMPNIRGNRYSKEHSTLKVDTKSYWNFSWHDIAQHDVPAIIDYIKRVKGSETKIVYIGHSMGTSILFAMLTLRPEYNDELVAGVALAPVVFMSDVKSPVKSLSPVASNVAYMTMLYGSHELLLTNSVLRNIAGSCDFDHIDGDICKNFVFSICGSNEDQFNKTLLPVFLKHIGTGTSWKTVVHFAQEMEAGGRFQMFDYGSYYNNKLYKSETPPEYDLSKVTVPIKLFWAQNDLLSSEKDVQTLYDKLPHGTERYLIPDRNFNHVDYLWARDAPRLLNNKLLETLERAFEKQSYLFTVRFG